MMDEKETTTAATPAEKARLADTAARQAQAVWEETKTRGRKAGERIGEEWERFSDTAQEYAREHSVGVALGSLGLGLVVGLAVGLLINRD
jgi:ElaB/YqjD/DUF883 family membrane-anchored ribosome-binding protein